MIFIFEKVFWRYSDKVLDFIREVGKTAFFCFTIFDLILRHGASFKSLVNQVYRVGVRSISTVVATGFFVGAIMAIQIYLQLKDFGAQSFLGGMTASITLRNVGPLLIGFVLSAKVGSYTTAELAILQSTDQISAIRCLGVDPLRYLVAPRFLSVVISSFLLLVIGLMTAIFGAVIVGSLHLGVNSLSFVGNIPTIVSGLSILTGILKSLLYGIIIATVSCYRGYHVETAGMGAGAMAVGETVKLASVQTLVTLLIADFAVSNMFGAFSS